MTYDVRLLRRALRDLEEIKEYIARDAPETAGSFIDGLLNAISGLSQSPRRGATPRDDRLRRLGYRYLVHGAYLVFYKVRGETVRVLRVLHGSRRYSEIL